LLVAGARPAHPTAMQAATVGVSRRAGAWLQLFVLYQLASQVLLAMVNLGPARTLVRIGAFGISLVFLAVLPGRAFKHPSVPAATVVLGLLFISIFRPDTTGLLVGVAQSAMYLAVLSPLFWVPRLRFEVADLRRVLILLWAFHTLSAGVGVLQVYFPGSFQANLSPVYAGMDEGYVNSLQITLASGARVFRPMGLTDIPGGAASAGFYAVLFGLACLLTFRRSWLKALCVGSMLVGMMCLYLCQVRALLVMTGVCVAAFLSMLGWQRRVAHLTSVLVLLVGVVLAGFLLAVAVGGEAVTDRLSSLADGSPSEVYYNNRGRFVEETMTELLPQYPIGAGLGRWGMTAMYFGDDAVSSGGALYVEIQWTGWLFDGGILMMLVYPAAILIAFRTVWRIAHHPVSRENELWLWAVLLVAYNVGTLAVTFSYPIFMSQGGLEFWFLNAALFAAARTAQVQRPVMGRAA
jgi:hypothetical protein